jgi:hypothetical protein
MDRPGTDLLFPVVTDGVTGNPLLTAQEASDLETGPGFDLRLVHHADCATQYEIRWFYDTWDTGTLVVGADLESPFLPPGISATSIGTDYMSDLFSIELNVKRAVVPGITLLIGPRFVYLQDDMTLTSVIPVGAINTVLRSDIETTNPLFGGQVGAETAFPISRDIYVTGFVKAGGYGNTAQLDTTTTLTVLGTTATLAAFEGNRSHGAFVGEVGGRLHYDLIPGALSLFAGYQATWIDGVALAPAQLLSGLTAVQVSNTGFFHGILIGGSARW